MASGKKKEINMIYWRNLFVPIVISLLILITIIIFVNINVGLPNPYVSPKGMFTGGWRSFTGIK
jgi:hypothetical protein